MLVLSCSKSSAVGKVDLCVTVLPQLREIKIIGTPISPLPHSDRNNTESVLICCVHHVFHDPVLSYVLPLHIAIHL